MFKIKLILIERYFILGYFIYDYFRDFNASVVSHRILHKTSNEKIFEYYDENMIFFVKLDYENFNVILSLKIVDILFYHSIHEIKKICFFLINS